MFTFIKLKISLSHPSLFLKRIRDSTQTEPHFIEFIINSNIQNFVYLQLEMKHENNEGMEKCLTQCEKREQNKYK